MDIKIIVALVGIFGVLVSACVQYFLGSKTEKGKKQLEIKTQAYLDFLNSVSEIASSSRHNKNRSLEQLQKLNQAKTRVVLIGSNSVVTHLHSFYQNYGNLDSDESFYSFSKIVESMRKDLSGGDSVNIEIICESLFNLNKKV